MHAADPCTPSIFRDASRDDRKSPERRVMTWGERGAAPPQAWTHTSQRETSRRGSQQKGAAVACLLYIIYIITDLFATSVCDFHVGSLRLSPAFGSHAAGHVRARIRGIRMRAARSLVRLKKRRRRYRPPMMPDGTVHRRHSTCLASTGAHYQPSTGWPRYAATLVAAMAPSEAAVTICRRLFCRTSPAAKSPGVEVSMRSLVTT